VYGEVGERAAALTVTIKQPQLNAAGPDFYHRDPLASVVEGGAVRGRSLERELKTDRSKQSGEF
jgi:hypothetical protein